MVAQLAKQSTEVGEIRRGVRMILPKYGSVDLQGTLENAPGLDGASGPSQEESEVVQSFGGERVAVAEHAVGHLARLPGQFKGLSVHPLPVKKHDLPAIQLLDPVLGTLFRHGFFPRAAAPDPVVSIAFGIMILGHFRPGSPRPQKQRSPWIDGRS